MKVGIPKEIKSFEYRVGMTPQGVADLKLKYPNTVFYVETGAGLGSGYQDAEFQNAGAVVLPDAVSIYRSSELIIKVKEPLGIEYSLINSSHTVFTYFHFASSLDLTKAMLESKARCIAYETVRDQNGQLPLLTPMSEVAGRLAVQQGAKFLEKAYGGKGKLLGGIPGVAPAKVLVIGGGVVGCQAALMASGLGANVIVFEINPLRVRELCVMLPSNVTILYAGESNLKKHLVDADLVVGAVLVPGAKAPRVLSRDMLLMMEPGTVLVDVAIDQGGCFETSKPTSHQNPVFVEEGVVHYCVPNMPGAVPQTSTIGLTYNTQKYLAQMLQHGIEGALEKDLGFMAGLSIENGKILDAQVQNFWNLAVGLS